MAEIIINNFANLTGNYGTEAVEFASTIATTTIITGLEATKTADKLFWVNGPLTYTISIANTTTETFGGGQMIDTLVSQIKLIANTVKINGVDTTYDLTGNILTVALPDIEAGETVDVTFQVEQA